VKGGRGDAGTHTVSLRWLNPAGDELWSSNGELEIGVPPGGVVDMDVPLIATVDLPLDRPGQYTLSIALDELPMGDIQLMARVGAPQAPPVGLVS
jgi:hypothetical protein